jgi:hypothetical protein
LHLQQFGRPKALADQGFHAAPALSAEKY